MKTSPQGQVDRLGTEWPLWQLRVESELLPPGGWRKRRVQRRHSTLKRERSKGASHRWLKPLALESHPTGKDVDRLSNSYHLQMRKPTRCWVIACCLAQTSLHSTSTKEAHLLSKQEEEVKQLGAGKEFIQKMILLGD